MKKVLFSILIMSCIIFTANKVFALANPWIDCGNDTSCGAKKAGFSFPLQVKNASVRAMDDMIEITFPLDKKRTVTVRKSQVYFGKEDENGIKDISGDYNNYPVNKSLLINGVIFNVRGENNKYYTVNFAAETGYYSFICDKGLKLKDIKYLYKLIEKAESPRHKSDE